MRGNLQAFGISTLIDPSELPLNHHALSSAVVGRIGPEQDQLQGENK